MGRARPGVSVLYASFQGRQLLVAGRPTEVGGLEQGLRVAQLLGKGDPFPREHECKRPRGVSWVVAALLGWAAAWGAPVLSLNSLDSLVPCFFFFFNLFLNFLCGMVSLLLHGLFSRCGERGLLFVGLGRLTVMVSLAAKRRLEGAWASVVAAPGL